MWIIFAVSASLLWGLTYAIDEQIFKHISVVTSLAIAGFFTFIVMLLTAYFTGTLKSDMAAINSSNELLYKVVAGVFTFVTAELLIGLSINAKNATLAGLIEISYPIFIALFAYLFFKESQINMSTILGGSLMFAGVLIIYFFNK